MKKWLNELFKSRSGVSSIRVMAMMSLIFGMVCALHGNSAEIVAIFVGAAFGGKVGQKFFETKQPPTSES
jgi:hypothetical protein